MKLLISEYICGGGMCAHPLPPDLQKEGLLMLESLIEDCVTLDKLDLIVTLDPRTKLADKNIETIVINSQQPYIEQLKLIAMQVDYTWIIAPESENSLANIILELTKSGIRVINSDVDSIRICADKIQCALHLARYEVPVIPVIPYGELENYKTEIVIKPRYGVGCENVQLIASGDRALPIMDDPQQWIAQPYVEGEHRSLSVLCNNGKALVLSCNNQVLSSFPRPKLLKCVVNSCPVSDELHVLANQIAKALPGLCGYVGIDIIVNQQSVVVVEVNPRLTSSYAGLSNVMQQNPASLCLQVFTNHRMPLNVKTTSEVVEVVCA